jgi:cellulose synthase/poly-beta-1,6-N-acetylglucosamine synthase-like glycosyltransferase
LGAIFGQRLRWFRGWIELILPSIPKVAKGRVAADAMVTLLGPLVFAMFPVLLGMAFSSRFFALHVPTHWLQTALSPFMAASFAFLLTIAGVAIAFLDKVSWHRAILWIPIIYLYWGFLNVVALVALLQALVRWPRRWGRTTKVCP